jgi:hypothetical protein
MRTEVSEETGMRHLPGLCALSIVVAAGSAAHATCDKDTDCKGDRICHQGECVDTATPAPPPVAPTLPAAENTAQACQDGTDNDADGFVDCKDQDCSAFVGCAVQAGPSSTYASSGWSRAAGITGLVFAPISLALFSASAATMPENGGDAVPAAPLAGSAGLLHIVGGAIAGAGALSARGVDHNKGCLVAGWILYGATIVGTAAAFAIGFGLEGGPPPAPVVGVIGLVGATGVVLLSVDALIVAGKASKSEDATTTGIHRTAPSFALYPVATPVVQGSRTVGMTGGLGLVF